MPFTDIHEDMVLTKFDEIALAYHELTDAAITRRSGDYRIDIYEDMVITKFDEIALAYHELMDAAITRRSGNYRKPKEDESESDSGSETTDEQLPEEPKACRFEACKCKASKVKANKAKACKTKACKCKGCHSQTRARQAEIQAAAAARNKRPRAFSLPSEFLRH